MPLLLPLAKSSLLCEPSRMFLASDNSGPVAPEIQAALAEANSGHQMAYGNDHLMDQVRARVREVFEAPEAAVYLVSTGTAANLLALSTLTRPWQGIYCSPVAHILVDECNGPEFFTGGARLLPVGKDDRITPQDFAAALAATHQGDVHCTQQGPLSITSVTEMGTVYRLDEIKALTAIATRHDLPVHLDGARFANAVVALDTTPADMTWRAGIDAVSFGGTKNGCMGVEAVIFFDPAHAWEFELRRKRAGHLFSKHRYLSAQMAAYLTDGLWHRLASAANANMAHLVRDLRQNAHVRFTHEPEANMAWVEMPRAIHRRLQDQGARYALVGALEGPDEDMLLGRLVCDWSITPEALDRFAGLVRAG